MERFITASRRYSTRPMAIKGGKLLFVEDLHMAWILGMCRSLAQEQKIKTPNIFLNELLFQPKPAVEEVDEKPLVATNVEQVVEEPAPRTTDTKVISEEGRAKKGV